ncbi:MAG: type II toxin-antitoxin system VapC family toxin [Candidatus Brocadiaceae bacterium]|nr:type II toxin-antitoxin system VapC family toxin [Candidatus Brocadiaceae bacterium]
MNLFVDTSALVKLYHREAGTENLTELLSQYAPDLVITIADLTRIEFHSTFLKRVRIKEIALEDVRKVFDAFDNDLQMFNVVEVDTVVKIFAMQLLDSVAHQISLRTLDAIQLATAIVSNQVVAVDYFVACDKCLLNIAGYYFPTFNPEVETIIRG